MRLSDFTLSLFCGQLHDLSSFRGYIIKYMKGEIDADELRDIFVREFQGRAEIRRPGMGRIPGPVPKP